MHIKRIELCGFKSYREVTVVDNLSEGYNVIGARARPSSCPRLFFRLDPSLSCGCVLSLRRSRPKRIRKVEFVRW